MPPPATEVGPLLDDLAEFMNAEELPATLQAAIAHAQFETIHPFADGNGRVGRCLIHTIYRRRGLARHHVPPISLLMATDVDGYAKALTAYRERSEADWTAYFAQTAIAAADAAESLGERLADLQSGWHAKAAVRRGSTASSGGSRLPMGMVVRTGRLREPDGSGQSTVKSSTTSTPATSRSTRSSPQEVRGAPSR